MKKLLFLFLLFPGMLFAQFTQDAVLLENPEGEGYIVVEPQKHGTIITNDSREEFLVPKKKGKSLGI